jgi:hypothetical protein
MQKFMANLIKFDRQMSQQETDHTSAEPGPANTTDATENLNYLFQLTPEILDRESLRLFKAMDLAG